MGRSQKPSREIAGSRASASATTSRSACSIHREETAIKDEQNPYAVLAANGAFEIVHVPDTRRRRSQSRSRRYLRSILRKWPPRITSMESSANGYQILRS